MNAREPGSKERFAALLSRFPPGIAALATRCIPKLRAAIPHEFQLVYDYGKSVVVSFGLTENGSESLVALAIYPERVKLFFLDGKVLPDPKGRLEGTATRVRSVNLEKAADLDHPDIQALIKAQIKLSNARFPRTRSTQVVFKSDSKKPKAKKKKSAGKARRA